MILVVLCCSSIHDDVLDCVMFKLDVLLQLELEGKTNKCGWR